MNLLRGFRSALLLRRVLRHAAGIELQLKEQNGYLKRLADHFAPAFVEQPEARASVDFVRPVEVALTEAFVERTFHEQGRPPTDDEIERFLADETTLDARTRLEEV